MTTHSMAFSALAALFVGGAALGQEPKLRATLTGPENVHSVAFSPDGKLIASGGGSVITLWDVKSGEEKATLRETLMHANSVAFSPDGKLLASSGGRTVKLWDVTAGDVKSTLEGMAIGPLAFSPDGSLLASATHEEGRHEVKLWEVKKRLAKATYKGFPLVGSALAFSPDGTLLATRAEGVVTLIDVKTGEARTPIRITPSPRSLAFSPDGKVLAIGCARGMSGGDALIKLWDLKGRKESATLVGHPYDVSSLAFSPDGKLLASGSGDLINRKAGTIKLWDVKKEEEMATLRGHTTTVQVAFSPDGKLLASGGGSTILLWELATAEGLERIKKGK